MRGKYAEANIAFALANALHAAVAEIDHEDTDEDGALLPDKRLAADEPSIRANAPRTKPTTK